MSAGELPEEGVEMIAEEDVVAYLHEHPDILERHPKLLGNLRVPHGCEGAISLVEYQVNQLRGENREMRERIRSLVTNARDNEDLGRRFHGLTIELIGCAGASDAFSTLYQCLGTQFSVEHSAVRIFAPARHPEDAGLAEFDSAGRDLFAAALEADKPSCGRLRPEQVALLFGVEAERVGSAALMPLGGSRAFGLLGVAARDPQRYHPGMGTVFLRQVGELLTAVLADHVQRP